MSESLTKSPEEAKAEKQVANSAKKLAEIGKKKSLGTLLKEAFENLRKGNLTEALASATAIITAIFSGKLSNLKDEVEKTKNEKQKNDTMQAVAEEEPENEEYPETDEPNKPDAPANKKPGSGPHSADIKKFRKGELFAAIAKTFPEAEVQNKLVPLKTSVSKFRPGAVKWSKKSTDNWDYESAGNTEEYMKKGMYRIESSLAPNGYTRNVAGKVPSETAKKLTKIAVALLHDPRMPLFKGIAMKVDGVEVMMVKEIHMHPRGKASTYLCQPHTGVSYIMKKGDAPMNVS